MIKTKLMKFLILSIGLFGINLFCITNATNIFEKEINGVNTLTLCNPYSGTECLTLMDRNLGATTNDVSSTGSYGLYYQWGNNHGFKAFESITTGNQRVNCSLYSPLSGYDSDIFVVGYQNYCSVVNNNLWGGGSDSSNNAYGYPITNPLERQGPCPDGYHVPSQGEWYKLMNMRAGTGVNGLVTDVLENLGSQFRGDFNIPFAGYRSYNDGNYYDGQDFFTYFWSSSPNVGYQEPGMMSMSFCMGDVCNPPTPAYDNNQASAYSIRCFKNTALAISTDMVQCNESGAPENASYKRENVLVWQDPQTNERTEPANCSWYCGEGYITGSNNNSCLPTKMVQCNESGAPENASYEIENVLVQLDPQTNQYTQPTNCSWHCNTDYFKGYRDNLCHYRKIVYDDINLSYTLNGNEIFTGVGTISITDGVDTITLMDRNLGATNNNVNLNWYSYGSYFFGEQINTGSYGLVFQWGNNYGFNQFDGSITANTISGERIDTSGYGPNNYFSSNIFRKITNSPYDRSNPSNDNLWGGENDSDENGYGYPMVNPTDRQGPCPNGYHIPSQGERHKLMEIFVGTSMVTFIGGSQVWFNEFIEFQEAFKIPLNFNSNTSFENSYLWLSTPGKLYEGDNYQFLGNGSVSYSKIGYINTGSNRSNAYSIRCFKNIPKEFPKQMDIYVTVEGGAVTIGIGSGNSDLEKDLGTIGISNTDKLITGSFGENSFRVEDMKGLESGYYTTLSVSDLIGENNTDHIIDRSNIQFKPTALTKIGESSAETGASQVEFGFNDWTDCTWTGTNDSVVTYFNRQNTPMELAGRVGKRGDDLQVKVNIPANTLVDTYKGTITYTLYEL